MRTNHQNLATDNSVENKRMSLRRSNIAPLEVSSLPFSLVNFLFIYLVILTGYCWRWAWEYGRGIFFISFMILKINKFNVNYIFACQEKNKLHQCEFCEFSSNYSRNMRLHEECHRRNEEFKCSLCNFSSHAKFTVDSHLKRDHRSAPLSETIHILKSETKVGLTRKRSWEEDFFSNSMYFFR